MSLAFLSEPRWRVLTPIAATLLLLLLLGQGWALVITDVLIMVLFASSLNLMLSYGGMVSFGHAAYFGLGAYGLALSVERLGFPVWAGLLVGPLTAAVGALVFGAASRLNDAFDESRGGGVAADRPPPLLTGEGLGGGLRRFDVGLVLDLRLVPRRAAQEAGFFVGVVLDHLQRHAHRLAAEARELQQQAVGVVELGAVIHD